MALSINLKLLNGVCSRGFVLSFEAPFVADPLSEPGNDADALVGGL